MVYKFAKKSKEDIKMADSSASYIHMVHHLIEECLIFNMSKEECMESLSKHANIMPAITSTVWNELEKVNKDFFETYNHTRRDHHHQTQSISSSSSSSSCLSSSSSSSP
uniref:uncharacterized protein LOC122583836 n=1 Tax=Erigeron canadensis TaxID=72917 RepID=UPI001CB8C269|nr:uncharacterized protein LOC122583836 [Erigeron canadensis]